MSGIFSQEGKFALILNTIGDLIVLNLLTILTCIPIVTIGASISSLFQVTMRMAKGEEGPVVSSYFRAFKQNFKNSTLIWLIGGGLSIFIAFDIYLLMSVDLSFGQVYRIVLAISMGIVLLFTFFALVTNAYFENNLRNTIKNGILFCVIHIIPSILCLALMVAPLALLYLSNRFFILLVILGISGPAFLTSLYFADMFKEYRPGGKHYSE